MGDSDCLWFMLISSHMMHIMFVMPILISFLLSPFGILSKTELSSRLTSVTLVSMHHTTEGRI